MGDRPAIAFGSLSCGRDCKTVCFSKDITREPIQTTSDASTSLVVFSFLWLLSQLKTDNLVNDIEQYVQIRDHGGRGTSSAEPTAAFFGDL